MTAHSRTRDTRDVTKHPAPVCTTPCFGFVKLSEAPATVRKAAAAYLERARVKGPLIGAGRKVRR